MAMYNDIFMRDGLSDVGTIPSYDRNVCFSPDIIPVGTKPLEKPLSLIYEDWQRQVGRDLVQGYFNYIYVRGQNLGPNVAKGEVYLYYTLSSILLRPEDWKYNTISSSGSGNPIFKASVNGEHVLGDKTFLWKAPPQPHGWHYCLVSRVVTKNHPNEIPSTFANSGDFVNWVRNNPGIAWRNIYIQKQDKEVAKTFLYKFSNLDDFSEEYAIRATCRNLPLKTTVQLSCGSTGPSPQINITQSISNVSLDYVYTQSVLPAKFEGELVVTVILPNDAPWPQGAEISISSMKIVGGDDLNEAQQLNHAVLAKHAQHPAYFGLTEEHTTSEQLVLLGDAKIVFE